jgi:hypothetical protein
MSVQTILLLNAALGSIAIVLTGSAAFLAWWLLRRAPGSAWHEHLDDEDRLADSA